MFLLVNASIPCKIKGHNKKGASDVDNPYFFIVIYYKI